MAVFVTEDSANKSYMSFHNTHVAFYNPLYIIYPVSNVEDTEPFKNMQRFVYRPTDVWHV